LRGTAGVRRDPRRLLVEGVEVAAQHRDLLSAQRFIDLSAELAAHDQVASEGDQHDRDRDR
jgi:hypothetical protein